MSRAEATDGDGSMAALANLLTSSNFEVTQSGPNDTTKEHPRLSQYKNCGYKGLNQERRRKALLEHQKNRRTNAIDIARALVTGENLEEDSDGDDDDDEGDAMDVDKLAKRIIIRRSYKKQLMMSEWMVNVPEDLSSEWTVVPVPEGRRTLIVAGNGFTHRYNRHGRALGNFRSVFSDSKRKLRETILDTVFEPASGTYFVLDVMVYDGSSCYDCDTDFRFMWQKGKMFEDLSSLQTRGKNNYYAFKPLAHYPTDAKSLRNLLSAPDRFCFSPAKVDGLLFYHRKLRYMPGRTPLVTWLKAYMVPEMLGVTVDQELLNQRPADYVGVSAEITKFEEDYQERRKRRHELEKEAILL